MSTQKSTQNVEYFFEYFFENFFEDFFKTFTMIKPTSKQTLLLTEVIESPHNCAQIVCTLHSELEILLTVSGQFLDRCPKKVKEVHHNRSRRGWSNEIGSDPSLHLILLADHYAEKFWLKCPKKIVLSAPLLQTTPQTRIVSLCSQIAII